MRAKTKFTLRVIYCEPRVSIFGFENHKKDFKKLKIWNKNTSAAVSLFPVRLPITAADLSTSNGMVNFISIQNITLPADLRVFVSISSQLYHDNFAKLKTISHANLTVPNH